MIYIPMLKNRQEEMRIFKAMKESFSEKVIPLVEIISEEYQIRYLTDDKGEYVKKKINTRYTKVKCKPTEQDIITLEKLNDMADGRKMFIDYFRFSLSKYGKNIDFKKAELAFRLNNSYELYKSKVFSIVKYKNMIPVISVKPEYEIQKSELRIFIANLQKQAPQIALRITEEWLEEYRNIICDCLREEDFLLFDIEEQNPKTKFMEMEELNQLNTNCKIVLLNSPRKAAIKNGEYPEYGVTELIDNCARYIAEENELFGYGDYCGLKDAMPLNNGSNGKGAALALFYDFSKNIFYSYCNHNTSLGMQGYKGLIPLIRKDEAELNKSGDCPGFKRMNQLSGSGSWSTWHYINAIRYIYQTSSNLQ